MPVYDELQSDIQALHEYHQYEAALAWMQENAPKKEKAAIATGQFPDINAFALRRRRTGEVVNGEEYSDRKILTLVEMIQLAKWLANENDAGWPNNREQTRAKIVEMLTVRLKSTGRPYPDHRQ